MQPIGFKRMTIQVLGQNEKKFVIEGESKKGATKTAKISGLAADPVPTYGSDIAYYTTRRGVGEVKADFELIDIPMSVQKEIFGYKAGKTATGLTFIGEDTEAPEVSVLLEAPDTEGNAYIGFFKGTFSKEDIDLKTMEAKKDGLESQKASFLASPGTEGDAKGQYVAIGIDKETNGTGTNAKALASLLGMTVGA